MSSKQGPKPRATQFYRMLPETIALLDRLVAEEGYTKRAFVEQAVWRMALDEGFAKQKDVPATLSP